MALQLSLFDPEPAGPGPSPPSSAGRVLIARGALAAEALLLERVGALLAEARQDPRLLARPVRVVVPSRSLRLHVAAALVRGQALGRSVAGVQVQTLNGLAMEVLERAGEAAPRGTPLFDVLAQRLARIEPALRRGLEELVDGYAAVAGTVRDLLDAGMELDHAEAADEALAGDGHRAASRAEVERARALVRVAGRTERLLAQAGLGRVSTLLRRAAELLESRGDELLPARAVLVHGFADATGVATDLLQTLLRRRVAWVILDRPGEAAGVLGLEDAAGVEKAFTRRFTERLAVVALPEPAEPESPPAGPRMPFQVAAFEAAGTEAEAREVALRVRALLDGGARPEGIGVAARDLGRHPLLRLALRRHFQRLGVPVSGVGERGSLEPAGRRARAFLELLQRGEEVPSDRWLDAAASLGPQRREGLFVDLRLAFSSLGAGRLRDAAVLPVDEILGENDSFPLPIRQGLKRAGRDAEPEDEEAEPEGRRRDREGESFAARRRIAGPQLRGAVRAAARVRERLAAWPDEAPAAEHLRRLRALLAVDLGWKEKDDEARPVFVALESLQAQVPGDFLLTRHEARLLLARELESAGTGTVGGAGGGVQVLAVMEARGRTFEHLFVLGLNRDVFPRPVREDPLLPDGLRQILQRVLPDVPIKRSGFDEDRYLFAQLLSTSPAVTLSWQTVDDDGRPLPVSPLVERLRDALTVEKAPPLFAAETLAPARARAARPAHEHAVLAALHGTRRDFGSVLPAAVREATGREGGLAIDSGKLAAVRLAVLEEMDPDRRTPEGRAAAAHLGPYFGFAGPMAPRELYITYLEGLAACPWQLFLGRLLRLEPTPDPLEALPGADPLLLGNLVHAVLDRIADPAETPAEAVSSLLAREPAPVRWPVGEELDRLLREEARRLLAEEGIFFSGLARALAERARPLLEAARDADWGGAEGTVPVLGSEVEGGLTVADARGRPRFLRFKADRLDRRGDLLLWTDYKTGKPFSASKKPETRRRHFLARVRSGANLQGVAYLLAAEGTGRPGVGRYLFLRPDLETREFSVEGRDRPFLQAFQGAVETVLGAWDAGSFFPRVADPSGRDEPPRCQFCAVAESCLRGDSGARLRIVEWARGPHPPAPSPASPPPSPGEGEANSHPELAPEEAALLRLWRLAAPVAAESPEPEEEGG